MTGRISTVFRSLGTRIRVSTQAIRGYFQGSRASNSPERMSTNEPHGRVGYEHIVGSHPPASSRLSSGGSGRSSPSNESYVSARSYLSNDTNVSARSLQSDQSSISTTSSLLSSRLSNYISSNRASEADDFSDTQSVASNDSFTTASEGDDVSLTDLRTSEEMEMPLDIGPQHIIVPPDNNAGVSPLNFGRQQSISSEIRAVVELVIDQSTMNSALRQIENLDEQTIQEIADYASQESSSLQTQAELLEKQADVESANGRHRKADKLSRQGSKLEERALALSAFSNSIRDILADGQTSGRTEEEVSIEQQIMLADTLLDRVTTHDSMIKLLDELEGSEPGFLRVVINEIWARSSTLVADGNVELSDRLLALGNYLERDIAGQILLVVQSEEDVKTIIANMEQSSPAAIAVLREEALIKAESEQAIGNDEMAALLVQIAQGLDYAEDVAPIIASDFSLEIDYMMMSDARGVVMSVTSEESLQAELAALQDASPAFLLAILNEAYAESRLLQVDDDGVIANHLDSLVSLLVEQLVPQILTQVRDEVSAEQILVALDESHTRLLAILSDRAWDASLDASEAGDIILAKVLADFASGVVNVTPAQSPLPVPDILTEGEVETADRLTAEILVDNVVDEDSLQELILLLGDSNADLVDQVLTEAKEQMKALRAVTSNQAIADLLEKLLAAFGR